MLQLPALAKSPAAFNVVPVAVLVLIGLWAARRLVKLAVFLLALAVVVGAFLWLRGGL
jgi:4-amino-4-deoxy-L-arabinose transferase-like glycosyltransferase